MAKKYFQTGGVDLNLLASLAKMEEENKQARIERSSLVPRAIISGLTDVGQGLIQANTQQKKLMAEQQQKAMEEEAKTQREAETLAIKQGPGGKSYPFAGGMIEKAPDRSPAERWEKDYDTQNRRIFVNKDTGQVKYPTIGGKPYSPPRESLTGLIGAGLRQQAAEDEVVTKMKSAIIRQVPVYGEDEYGNKIITDQKDMFDQKAWDYWNKQKLTPARRKVLDDLRAIYGSPSIDAKKYYE